MDFMVRAYRYEAMLNQDHREEMRDAGREYREMQSEINSLERQIEDRY